MKQNTLRWVMSLLLIGVVQATPQVVPVSELVPTDQQRRTALIIAQVLENFHYTKPDIDDSVASLAFDRYLESLDANRSFLTRDDVRRFEFYRKSFDDNLRSGHLDPAYAIFKRFREKVEHRVAYAKRLLDSHQFDFKKIESYTFDRTEGQWAANEAALDDLWRKKVKNDLLSDRLSSSEESDPVKVKETLHKRYTNIARRVKQMNAVDVFRTFVNAFTLSIEPHTSYMSPRSSENFDIGMRLSLQGIGAVLRSENEHTQIMKTVPGGPAARSGKLGGGDRIVGVAQGKNGEMEDVVGWRLQDVVDLIRGPKDSIVRLNVLPKREGLGGRSEEIVLVRDKIKLEDKAAKIEILDGPALAGLKIGVIEIPAFYRDFGAQSAGDRNFRSTTRDTRKLLAELEAAQVDGVIIDLRQNGGGSLAEATELTGLFIDQGPVVQVKDAMGNVEVERDTDPEQVYAGPLAVLVDRNSASASEIFAGAIQDYDRGLIIGEPTFGKGTVQTLVNIGRYLNSKENLGRLRLTMAQFFRVQGASTQHRGVMPDIIFPTSQGAAEHGERALDHAIPFAAIAPAVNKRSTGLSVSTLRNKDLDRIERDPGFRFLMEREKEIMRITKETQVSLNEALRRAERTQRDADQLASLNRLRQHRGLEVLSSLDKEDDDLNNAEKDVEGIKRIMLDESANILADYIHLRRPMTAQVD